MEHAQALKVNFLLAIIIFIVFLVLLACLLSFVLFFLIFHLFYIGVCIFLGCFVVVVVVFGLDFLDVYMVEFDIGALREYRHTLRGAALTKIDLQPQLCRIPLTPAHMQPDCDAHRMWL